MEYNDNNQEKNYKFIFNKVFTGSYLNHNLGHEIINFIKTDEHERYIYLNPWGNRNKEHYQECEYVFHVMKVNYKDSLDSNCYELIALSQIDKEAKTVYKQNAQEEDKEGLNFENLPIYEIFKDEKAHLYTFKASKFYKPKKKYRIFFIFNCDKPKKGLDIKDNVIKIYVSCYPKHHVAYAKNIDTENLEKLISSPYLQENDDNVTLSDYDDEQCLAVISDRTNLEDSISNQIAYFLNRDKNNVLKSFIALINKHINDKIPNAEIKDIEIFREKHNIDLLLKSPKHIIVIENKIDSHINGIQENFRKSQLSSYYNYIMKEFKDIPHKHFFILKPEYNTITEEEKNKYQHGKDYKFISYDDLYKALKTNYEPYKNDDDKEKRNFLYQQFLQNIEYVKSSKAEQMQKTAYIRLNQRIKELKNKDC